MITKLISRLIGDPNDKIIKRCRNRIEIVKKFEEDYREFSEADVKNQTASFKERLQKGEPLDNLLPEAFALVKQACKLLKGKKFTVRGHEMTWDMIPYDVQLIGGMILHEGNIAEMKTGEGKTLVATLPLYLNALTCKGAFLVTVNEYLAQRDAEWMGFLYGFLGLTVGVIQHGQNSQEKKSAYACDITYGTNNEFGFDYLRDNMASDLNDCVQRELNYAIVDEVDSILIDEARTPLIISAAAEESTEKYQKYAQLVTQLEQDKHYKVDEKSKSCILTDEGIEKMEKLLGMDNIYTEAGASEVHHIEQSLKARTLFHKDVDYMIQNGEIVIVDEFTGRLMVGRRYSEGLHQAIEAKEGVEVKKESKTLATITFQNYFRLFEKLAGMTGTAITEAEEFSKIYSLETIIIPTNVQVQRKDANDLIYKNTFAKFQAVTKKVKELQEKGQPVLVGTVSVEKSEILSQLFQQSGIRHEVLNAKHHEREAEIVSLAGKEHNVTIATNMAGRGTDIKIDDTVKNLGGLFIIGTERHESRRIDNQLRGRSGRQGDPGMSQFYVSMDDELMRLFGGDRMKSIMETLKVPEDMPIENMFISRSIESAQKRVEGHNFDIRKHLVEYDDVMNRHRTIIYSRRRTILENENVHDSLVDLMKEVLSSIIRFFIPSKYREEWKVSELIETLHGMCSANGDEVKQVVEKNVDEETIKETLVHQEIHKFTKKREAFGNDELFLNIEKQVYLRTIDKLWMDHIDAMMKLREQVSFRGYAQKDPLIEYKNDGFTMFETLVGAIQSNTVQTLFKMEFKPVIPQQKIEQIQTNEQEITNREFTLGQETTSSDQPVIRVSTDANNVLYAKVGRNDDCPCGSGKKYKKCHGAG